MRRVDAELHDLMTFAKAYASLGTAVQEQLDDLLDGDDRMNPNAVTQIKRTLGGVNDDLDERISDFLTESQAT